jgi:hypothetical protein
MRIVSVHCSSGVRIHGFFVNPVGNKIWQLNEEKLHRVIAGLKEMIASPIVQVIKYSLVYY